MPDSPPSHLPGPFPDQAAYERAYEYVRNVRDVYHGTRPGAGAGGRCGSGPARPPRRSTGCCLQPPDNGTCGLPDQNA